VTGTHGSSAACWSAPRAACSIPVGSRAGQSPLATSTAPRLQARSCLRSAQKPPLALQDDNIDGGVPQPVRTRQHHVAPFGGLQPQNPLGSGPKGQFDPFPAELKLRRSMSECIWCQAPEAYYKHQTLGCRGEKRRPLRV
jgi:hypothetical protein